MQLCRFAAVIAGVIVTGCASTTVRVNTFLSHELPFPAADGEPAPTVAVIVGSQPKEPLLEAEVARKVRYLLGERGFSVGEEAAATHILTVWVGIDQGVSETVYDTFDTGPHFATTHVYTHRGHWHAMSIGHRGGVHAVPHTHTYYRRELNLTMYDRERWVAADDEKVGKAAIWTCTATSIGGSTDLRTIVNYLLAAGFKHFGRDTIREIRLSITPDDPGAQRIATAGLTDDAED